MSNKNNSQSAMLATFILSVANDDWCGVWSSQNGATMCGIGQESEASK